MPPVLGLYLLPRRYGEWRAEIDPARVVFRHGRGEWPRYVKRWPSLVCPGSWDLSDIERSPPRLKQMRELFVDGVPFRDSGSYESMLRELETRGVTHAPKLRSRDAIDAYFQQLEGLHESMARHGFQARRGEEVSAEGEITVRVGRDGALIKCGEGTHRLALARVLGIKRVPVVVDLVHWQWARRCMAIAGAPASRSVAMGLAQIAAGSARDSASLHEGIADRP